MSTLSTFVSSAKEWATAGLMLIGALFMLLAAVGVLRMPDLYTRMQSATKASTLGVGCMMLAVAVHFSTVVVTARAVAGIVFLALTAPVAAHMIGRAAYALGVAQWTGTWTDEMADRYDTISHTAKGEGPPQAPPQDATQDVSETTLQERQ